VQQYLSAATTRQTIVFVRCRPRRWAAVVLLAAGMTAGCSGHRVATTRADSNGPRPSTAVAQRPLRLVGPAKVTPYVYPTPDSCPTRRLAPQVRVTLTAIGGKPDIQVHVHATFQVVVYASPRGRTLITRPIVTPADAVCTVSLSPLAPRRTATYYVLQPGRIIVAATITGVPGGIGHPVFSATFHALRRAR
jgi:hypothetical protein